jgi:hypothetical protein
VFIEKSVPNANPLPELIEEISRERDCSNKEKSFLLIRFASVAGGFGIAGMSCPAMK